MNKTLGLAMRARKLTLGTELVLKELSASKIKLVLISDQASSNTKKLLANKTTHYNVELKEVDDYILNQSIGKTGIKVVGVIDQGFADLLISKGGM